MSEGLAGRISPCGPVVDVEAAERARVRLSDAAQAADWLPRLEAAWPALAPVFSASPYLFGIARRWPDRLKTVLESDPDARLAQRARQLARRHQITVHTVTRRAPGFDGVLAQARAADLLVVDLAPPDEIAAQPWRESVRAHDLRSSR